MPDVSETCSDHVCDSVCLCLRFWLAHAIGKSPFSWPLWCPSLGFAWPCPWKWYETLQWWWKLATPKQEKFVHLDLNQWHPLGTSMCTYQVYHSKMTRLINFQHRNLKSEWQHEWHVFCCSLFPGDSYGAHQNGHSLQWSKSGAGNLQ